MITGRQLCFRPLALMLAVVLVNALVVSGFALAEAAQPPAPVTVPGRAEAEETGARYA